MSKMFEVCDDKTGDDHQQCINDAVQRVMFTSFAPEFRRALVVLQLDDVVEGVTNGRISGKNAVIFLAAVIMLLESLGGLLRQRGDASLKSIGLAPQRRQVGLCT